MHSAFIVTAFGLSALARQEAEEMGAQCIKELPFGVEVNASLEIIARIAYRSQTATRVIYSPVFFTAHHELKETATAALKAFDPGLIEKLGIGSLKTRVDCERFGEHGFRSMDLAGALGTAIHSLHGVELDMEEPAYRWYAIVDGAQGVLGVDLCGYDLSKRYYKVFSTPSSLRGPSGYALSRLSNPKGAFLDPFCNGGICTIELAHWVSGKSVRFYEREKLSMNAIPLFSETLAGIDKDIATHAVAIYAYDAHMPHLVAAKKNAKIAGVQKDINFGRADLQWLDIKFKEHEMSSIVIYRPRMDEKFLKQVWYQVDFVAKKRSTVVLASLHELPDAEALRYGFLCASTISIGRTQPLLIRVYART